MKNYLDESLEKYFFKILNSNGFQLVGSQFSGMGGLYRFESDHLKFAIINDRGLIETTIASIYSKNDFDLELLSAYFLTKMTPDCLNAKFGESILSKRLNLEEQNEFFEKQFDWIKTIFTKTAYLTTESDLSNLANERVKVLFGNRL
jgi:hypothetical protein